MSVTTNGKTALVFGATGLTGGELVRQLLKDNRYTTVKVFSRKKFDSDHPGLVNIIDPLIDPERIADKITGDDLFCCLGSTMKKAGSKAAFEWADLVLPGKIAEIASRNEVSKFLIISSIGANPLSSNFYLRTKGKMENRISENRFEQIFILRPSILLGKRQEYRFGEESGKTFMKIFSFLLFGPLRKYRGIEASRVAEAMILLVNSDKTKIVYESDEIQDLHANH